MAILTYGTTGAATTASVWCHWVGTCGSATTASNDTCWVQWNTGSGFRLVNQPQSGQYVAPKPPTAEQLAATEARAEQYRKDAERYKKQAEEERLKRIAAEKKAEKLLKEHLSKEQLQEYEKDGHFHVIGESGQRYRIRTKSPSINVDVIKDGKTVRKLCAHPPGVPLGDAILCQKLALEHDEKAFLKIANVHAA